MHYLEYNDTMKLTALILMLAVGSLAAIAQPPTQPAATGTKTAPAAKPATTATKPVASGTTANKPVAAATKLPFGVPAPGLPAVKTLKQTAFSLRYQEIKVGTGAVAEPNKLYKVHYTGWLAADGTKFDSSYDHPRQPLKDKDGKPVLGDDGQPKLDDPQPISFPQGFGRVIPGWDQGFEGMKIGGKRRIFIPWELAYGAKGRPGPNPEHPGIPPKADLIFDVELVDVTDMPAPQARPNMPMGGRPMPPRPPAPPAPGAAPNAAAPAPPPVPPAPGAAPAPPAPIAPPPPPATPATAPAAPAPPQPK